MNTALKNNADTLYQTVAERFRTLIERGTLRPGERMPSVRSLHREMGVSISTVLEAYSQLESQGLIEARPQSGYYVRAPHHAAAAEIRPCRPVLRSTDISIEELVLRVMQDMMNPHLVQLGAAVPGNDLLPVAQLNRHLVAAARASEAFPQRYDMPPGCEALRVQIARLSVSAGATLSPDDVVTTNGCLEALSLCLRAVCQSGDTVAIESPTYFGVLQAMQQLGLRVLEIPTHPRDGISLDALRFAVDHHPVKACLVIANFNNPLGSLVPEDSKRALVALLGEREIPLIEDDVYGDLYFGGSRPRTAKSFDANDGVMLCSSFSKDITPSYRIGWAAPGRWKDRVMRLKAATNVATATLPQQAIAGLLAAGGHERHMRRVRRVYATNASRMVEAVLDGFPEGTRTTTPQGGFTLWVEMPRHVDSLRLYEQALQAGITFAPGPLFTARSRYRNCLRLNCATWSDSVERAVRTLGRLATAQ